MTSAPRLLLPSLVFALAALAPASAAAAPATLLRLKGIGPLHLGMRPSAALATGWLADRGTGCELGGRPFPVTYRFTGPDAPAGIRGTAEFRRGRLETLSFTRGVRTATGVRVGRTTVKRMVQRYRAAGFGARAQFVDTFQGTFVTVRRHGRVLVGGFAPGPVVRTLAIPAVPVCE